MTPEQQAALRERRRAAALAMPRAGGKFAKRAADQNEAAADAKVALPQPTTTTSSAAVEQSGRSLPRTTKAKRKTRLSRKTIVARVSASVERELVAVEQLLRDAEVTSTHDAETERRARTLASLTRTLRELSQLQQVNAKPKAQDDDAIPRDLDELRRELARRLDGLIADAKAVHPDGTGIAVDGAADEFP